MKPVTQTITDSGKGNCMSACLASLLELDINEVPNFVAENGDEWLVACNMWLSDRGLTLIMMKAGGEIYGGRFPFIVSCASPRSTVEKPLRHAVVMSHGPHGGLEVLHDPYPGSECVTGYEEWFFVYILVPQTETLPAIAEHDATIAALRAQLDEARAYSYGLQRERDEAREIALAEYSYWKRISDEDEAFGPDPHSMGDICIGALGASANIAARLSGLKVEPPRAKVDKEAARKMAQQLDVVLKGVS